MTADQPDGSARGERGGWLSSPLARWLLGVAGSYSEVLAAVAIVGGKLPALFKIPRALRPLDAGARIVAVACLVLLALLVGATYLLPELAHRLTTLTWADGGQTFTLPRVALYLSLIGWAISDAMILAGASRWNLSALVLAGIVQLFAIVFIGLAGGKAYWLAAPSWLLPLLAATSPAVARWPTGRVAGTVSLCALATWHTYLFTPLSAHGRPPRWGWLLALLAVSVPVLLRLPRRSSLWGAFVLALAVNVGVLLPSLRVGEPMMARGLVIPTSFFVGLFAVMWFTLGGELVAGAVTAANSAIKIAAVTVRRQLLPLLVVALCLLEVAVAPWMLDHVSTQNALALSLHRWLALGLGLAGLALAARRRLTNEWTRTLLVVWAFGLAALRTYFSDAIDLAAYADPQELKRLALTLFAFAMAMQVVGLLLEKPNAAAGGHDARLFLQLGALAFLATGTQFEFAIDNTHVMKEAAVYQFAGATALFLPLLLALLVKEQRWLPAPAPALLVRGFLVGFAAAFAVQLVRIATYGPGGWSLAGHLGAMAAADAVKAGSIAVLIVLAGAVGRVDAPAGAIACALGFAAGYAQNLIVLMLDAGVKMLLLLTVRSTVISEGLSALVGGYVRMRPALPAADHYHLFVASLLPAAIMGWAIAKGVREARPVAGALGVVGGLAISLGFAWALQVHPVFMTESRQPLPFYLVLTDASALPPLLLSVTGLVVWLYLVVWRPERRAPSEPATARATGGVAVRPGRRWAIAAAMVTPVLALGALGLGLAWRAPSPMQEYQDPDRRFSIDYPRGWRVERRSGGETVFYRDDPVHGVLVMLHPGIALPGTVSAAQLVEALGRRIRAVYPDARITASPPAVRSESGRSMERIELAVMWTGPSQSRLRSQSTITLISASHGSSFSYLTFQLPEPAPRSLETFLARVLRSYRAAEPW